MWDSKDTNFFEGNDEDFLSFKLDDYEYLQTASVSTCSDITKLPSKKKKNEMPKAENASNSLSTFLHNFDFQPRADVITDTSLETIVKDANKFKCKPQNSSYSKACPSNFPDNSSNSIMCNNGKRNPVSSPIDDVSFDVFFEEDDDFAKSFDDSPQKNVQLSNKLYDGSIKCEEITLSKFAEMTPTEEFLSFSPKKSMTVGEGKKKNFDNDENYLVLSNPSTSIELFENLSCQNKKAILSLTNENLEFRMLDLKSPLPNSSAITWLSANHSSHEKTRKRKFPGPAGLLPDVPPGSPLVPQQHECSLKLDPLENSTDQEVLYSQSSRDDFLCASWSSMTKDLASCNNSIFLTKFNIKRIRQQASKKKLPKYVEVPFLCVLIKSFMLKGGEVIIMLKDETGEISGKVHKEVSDKHKDSLKVGASIVLKKTAFLFGQLGIKLCNIIRIYDTSGNKICVNDWNHVQEVPYESTLSHSCSEPPQAFTGNRNTTEQRNNKDQETEDYIVDFMDDTLFEDDLNDIVSTLDEDSFTI